MTTPPHDAAIGSHAPLTPARVGAVRITDPFWAAQQLQTATVALPRQLEKMRERGNLDALALHWSPASGYTPHVFWDSDLAKWLEAASYVLATREDADLEAAVDRVIDLLAAAQQADGYLNSYFSTVGEGRRFTDHNDAHELYCAGHLIEAGVAHFESTGRRTLLDVVMRYADLIDAQFSDDGPDAGGFDGHPEIELALVRLARATGESRYTRLAQRLVENRGRSPFFENERLARGDAGMFADTFPGRQEHPELYAEYQQSHLPVREQREAVGHAVRAVYLYTGAFDVGVETADRGLIEAVDALWADVTERKMHVTANIGTNARFEAFGPAFDLPTARGYGETCASIGLAIWAERLANARRDSRYVDVLETALYNGALAGKSADGLRYFYDNQLSSDGSLARRDWFDTSCCPPNLARFLASAGRLVYSVGGDTIAVNLFVASEMTAALGGREFRVRQDTDFPRSGRVTVVVDVDEPTEATLAVRIPDYAGAVLVDGTPLEELTRQDGYLVLRRTWAGSTRIELDIDLPIQVLHARGEVTELRGRIAVRRGPVVYCIEQADAGVPTGSLLLEPGAIRVAEDSVSGHVDLLADAIHDDAPAGSLYEHAPHVRRRRTVRMVPYFFWGNREPGTMDVWVREAVPGEGTQDVAR